MKQYHLSTIGTFHTNHNEDYLAIYELGKEQLLTAVMDGCSMGKDSYFIATLIGKILRKIAKVTSYQSFINKEQTPMEGSKLLKIVTQKLFLELKNIQNTFL